jgi:hypothetical protein
MGVRGGGGMAKDKTSKIKKWKMSPEKDEEMSNAN